jgi:carbon-monoxide dehydrogenase large subunit
LDGAEKFRAAVIESAANLLGRPNSELRFANGLVVSETGGSISLMQLAASREPEEGLLAADGIFLVNKPTYSYGTHAAHVAVDPDTGQVEVLDYIAVEDVGRAINPMIVSGQAIGALVQGLGGVFLDHLIYDDECQLLTASFADYLMPTATDFPNLRSVALELRLSPTNPLGAKSAGEGGMVPVAAAIGNAVGAALKSIGAQPRTLPLSPPKIWSLIHEREEAEL